MKQQQITQIKKVILENPEGFTCDMKGNLIKENKGFFVSISNIKGKRINLLIKKLIMIKNIGFKENKNLFVGGWRDNNIYFLDLSLFVEDFKTAYRLASLFNQKAIFDIKNLRSIYL